MLDFGEGRQLPRAAVEEYLQHPVLEFVSFNPAEVNEAANNSLPVVRLRPDGPTAARFLGIVRHLVGERQE
jgi:hypothetical protein